MTIRGFLHSALSAFVLSLAIGSSWAREGVPSAHAVSEECRLHQMLGSLSSEFDAESPSSVSKLIKSRNRLVAKLKKQMGYKGGGSPITVATEGTDFSNAEAIKLSFEIKGMDAFKYLRFQAIEPTGISRDSRTAAQNGRMYLQAIASVDRQYREFSANLVNPLEKLALKVALMDVTLHFAKGFAKTQVHESARLSRNIALSCRQALAEGDQRIAVRGSIQRSPAVDPDSVIIHSATAEQAPSDSNSIH